MCSGIDQIGMGKVFCKIPSFGTKLSLQFETRMAKYLRSNDFRRNALSGAGGLINWKPLGIPGLPATIQNPHIYETTPFQHPPESRCVGAARSVVTDYQ